MFLALLPPTVFFVALHIIGLVRILIVEGTGLPVASSAQIVWPHLLAIQIILLVIVFNYCVIRELSRVLGEDRTLHMSSGIRSGDGAPR